MAEHRLETVIQLRYGTYEQWLNSRVVLKLGEAAICSFPNETAIDGLSTTTPSYTPPAIGIKIGDGHSYFYELPWVQAVAADVYNWAKRSTKPTYSASEITGLVPFIEENFNLGGDVTIAPRIYQIIRGTDENINKYFLRYKENNEDSPWIIDTNNPIDVTAYEKVANWIGIMVDRFPTLGTFTGSQMDSKIAALNVEDVAQTNKFVTAVSETGGKVVVERAQPTFTNIGGVAPVTKGGTGLNTLTEDSVLVGNGTDNVKLIPIAESVTNNNHLVPNKLMKTYVDNAVAGLENAMHFIGEAAAVINNNSNVDPNIILPDGKRYDFSAALPGDVILYESKEFIWTGSNWRLFGDEANYTVSGQIKDIDIAEDAGIQQSKIANLDTTLDRKVDKEEGKTLSSNDFTDAFKEKLNGIEDGAQVNLIEHIILNDMPINPTTVDNVQKVINLHVKEFDDGSREKLAGIEPGAQVNTIDRIMYGSEVLVPANQTITIPLPDPHTDHINKIEHIFLNDVEWEPNNNKEVRIRLDQSALNLNVLEGAVVPDEQGGVREVSQSNKKLELNRIAVTADVKELTQLNNTYITFNCGSSTDVI